MQVICASCFDCASGHHSVIFKLVGREVFHNSEVYLSEFEKQVVFAETKSGNQWELVE